NRAGTTAGPAADRLHNGPGCHPTTRTAGRDAMPAGQDRHRTPRAARLAAGRPGMGNRRAGHPSGRAGTAGTGARVHGSDEGRGDRAVSDTLRRLLAGLTREQRQRIVDLHAEARAIAARATAGRLQTEAMRLTLTDALA